MLCILTIAMICSTLALLWKFQYFWRPIYNPPEHLRWSFYYENSKLLSIFTKSSIVDACLGSKYLCFFLRLIKRFLSLKYFTFKAFEICHFFEVLYFFLFIKHAIKYLFIKPFDLLNTIPLSRTKALVNNLFY